MIATVFIAFREFLEAFLITGIFLGVSRKLRLHKELEIGIAAAIGIGISFLLAGVTYAFGDAARGILTQQRAELLENYLLLFSGFFLAYVIFSLHQRISKNKKEIIDRTKNKLTREAFDISLFMTIIFLVAREGFEIALFTASTSLFSAFIQNIIGLFIGFGFAFLIGIGACVAYTKLPIQKIFKVTEYLIILIGAAMVEVGITELLEHQFGIHLGDMFSFHFNFLPAENSMGGHALRTFLGIDREFSLPRLMIMVLYIIVIYLIVRQKKEVPI